MKKIPLLVLLVLLVPLLAGLTSSALNDSLIHCYEFDDNDLTDRLFTLNGTNTGTTNISGIIIDARLSDGVTMINFSSSSFEVSVTYSFWFMTNSTSCGGDGCLIYYKGTVDTKISEFILIQLDKIRFIFGAVSGSNNKFLTTGDNIVVDNWTHVVIKGTGDGAVGAYEIWINNVNQTNDFTTQGGNRSRPGGSQISHFMDKPTIFIGLIGRIDEFRLYNRVITADEVGELYNSGKGVQCSLVTDSCTYTSGNWVVDCADNCTITSNVVGDGSNFSCIGTGTFEIDANISNFTKYHFGGACVATCDDGCIKF